MSFPQIIQGGMGAGVSSWRLARTVSGLGELGVVSGTALDLILARRLQMGDTDMVRALRAFPDAGLADRILDRYYIEGGKQADAPFRTKKMPSHNPDQDLRDLSIAGGFVEVWLAKEGQTGTVGINFLEKIQSPTLPILYGAILAGVDVVIVGAGIPTEFPGVIEALSANRPASLKLNVKGADEDHFISFDPMDQSFTPPGNLERPAFFAIVASNTLATMMVRKATGRVDGLIIEYPTAGGHNAPPRGRLQLSDAGEPLYGKRDDVDLEAIRSLETPFWLAGSYGRPEKFADAVEEGARGIQVGTLFAFSHESGLESSIRRSTVEQCLTEPPRVFTDPVASPTGFPFKVLPRTGTNSEQSTYEARPRCCDLGYLREPYIRDNGSVGWRCSSEPVSDYLRKGGVEADTAGRKCLCNGLMANIGMEQIQKDGTRELPLLTCGDDLVQVGAIARQYGTDYSAADVVRHLRTALSPRRNVEGINSPQRIGEG